MTNNQKETLIAEVITLLRNKLAVDAAAEKFQPNINSATVANDYFIGKAHSRKSSN